MHERHKQITLKLSSLNYVFKRDFLKTFLFFFVFILFFFRILQNFQEYFNEEFSIQSFSLRSKLFIFILLPMSIHILLKLDRIAKYHRYGRTCSFSCIIRIVFYPVQFLVVLKCVINQIK